MWPGGFVFVGWSVLCSLAWRLCRLASWWSGSGCFLAAAGAGWPGPLLLLGRGAFCGAGCVGWLLVGLPGFLACGLCVFALCWWLWLVSGSRCLCGFCFWVARWFFGRACVWRVFRFLCSLGLPACPVPCWAWRLLGGALCALRAGWRPRCCASLRPPTFSAFARRRPRSPLSWCQAPVSGGPLLRVAFSPRAGCLLPVVRRCAGPLWPRCSLAWRCPCVRLPLCAGLGGCARHSALLPAPIFCDGCVAGWPRPPPPDPSSSCAVLPWSALYSSLLPLGPALGSRLRLVGRLACSPSAPLVPPWAPRLLVFWPARCCCSPVQSSRLVRVSAPGLLPVPAVAALGSGVGPAARPPLSPFCGVFCPARSAVLGLAASRRVLRGLRVGASSLPLPGWRASAAPLGSS